MGATAPNGPGLAPKGFVEAHAGRTADAAFASVISCSLLSRAAAKADIFGAAAFDGAVCGGAALNAGPPLLTGDEECDLG